MRCGDVVELSHRSVRAQAAVPPMVSDCDPQRRRAIAHGHALAVFAARAGMAHGEVVADDLDVA